MNKCQGKTEIFCRIVGYFQPIQGWNPGKKEEYLNRTNYKISDLNSLKVEK